MNFSTILLHFPINLFRDNIFSFGSSVGIFLRSESTSTYISGSVFVSQSVISTFNLDQCIIRYKLCPICLAIWFSSCDGLPRVFDHLLKRCFFTFFSYKLYVNYFSNKIDLWRRVAEYFHHNSFVLIYIRWRWIKDVTSSKSVSWSGRGWRPSCIKIGYSEPRAEKGLHP